MRLDWIYESVKLIEAEQLSYISMIFILVLTTSHSVSENHFEELKILEYYYSNAFVETFILYGKLC